MIRTIRSWKIAGLVGALCLCAPVYADAGAAGAAIARAQADAGAAAPPRAEPRPAIWLLADEDTKIYMFGTMHILSPGLRWRSPAVETAISEAEELVLEISEREAMADIETVESQVQLGKQAPLHWRVSPDRREALGEMIEASGLPAETFDGLQTWAAVMTLAVAQIARSYSDEEGAPLTIADLPGVETALEAEFDASQRPISGVETIAEQLGFFASMSFASQREMLEEMVDAYVAGDVATDIGDAEWAAGNVEAIAREMAEMPPALYDVLLTRRNAAWTDWLVDRLERPGTILFAVGAGHLAGPDSVQAMLAGRGHVVERLD